MSNGNKRRDRKRQQKRYRVRYDRLLAVILVLIVLIVIITSCAKSCSGSSDTSSVGQTQATASDPQQQSSIVDNLEASDETNTILGKSTSGASEEDTLQFVTETHIKDDVYRGDLVLINSTHEYKFPSDDTELVTLYDNMNSDCYSVSDLVTKLDSNALKQLNALMEDFTAETQNTDITIIGGYRTLEEQNDKYYSGNTSFMGGCSDYHSGRTFDMGIFPKDGSSSGYYSSTGIYSWIDENAAEYGFIVRFPENKDSVTGEKARTYTYRYVGIPHAVYMKQNDLCLEEYIAMLKEHTNTKPIEVSAGTHMYKVYYVPAESGGDTEVQVPANKTYTVSGDNDGGFIVTVQLS